MEIRTFEAFSMKDAVKQVKDTFGIDAVILETKSKPAPAGKGLVYEVKAAPASESFTESSSTRSGGSGVASNVLDKATVIDWQRKLGAFEERLDNIYNKAIRREHLISVESSIEEVRCILLDYLSKRDDSSFRGLHPKISELIQRLKIMNIDEDIISQLANHLKVLTPDPNKIEDSLIFIRVTQSGG